MNPIEYNFISIFDFLLLPLYIFLVRQIGIFVRDKYYPEGHAWRPYLLPGLMIKVYGAIFISLLYQFYYGDGDTALYFHQAKVINSAFWDSPVKWFNLMFRIPPWYSAEYQEYIVQMPWYDAPTNYIVSTATSMVGIFTSTKYVCTAVCMAGISYTGLWAMFRTFVKQYPQFTNYIAICCLFIPSVAIWGSGIFKDTLCIFALGWLTYTVFQLLVQRRFSLLNIGMLLLSANIIGVAKIYILIAFLPSVALWVFLKYSYRIRSTFIRLMVIPLALAGIVAGFFVLSAKYADLLGVYTTDQFVERSAITRNYIVSQSSDENSTYTLGSFDPSIQGMLKKLPAAVNVTLFRPYVWEARKPIVFLNALESMLLFFLALKVLFQVGLRRAWQAIAADPNIQFFLIFTIIFGFAIGISTYNFGSLSRYRIPCLPFFAMALGLIYYKTYSPQERKFLPFGEHMVQ